MLAAALLSRGDTKKLSLFDFRGAVIPSGRDTATRGCGVSQTGRFPEGSGERELITIDLIAISTRRNLPVSLKPILITALGYI